MKKIFRIFHAVWRVVTLDFWREWRQEAIDAGIVDYSGQGK